MAGFNGSDYKPARPRNTTKRDKKPSRTPGKAKAETCQTDPTKKFWLTSPKAYRRKGYDQWHARAKAMNQSKVK